MRKIHTLVWHYTATPAGREVSIDEVRQWHRKRGFVDVGYHKLVHLDGSVSEGRPERQVGAHVAGHNTGTLGYCYVGGTAPGAPTKGLDTRTPAQKATMHRLTREAIARYGLTDVCGHRDLAATDCPGFDVRAEYGHMLRDAPPGPPGEDPAADSGALWRSRTVRGSAAAAGGGIGMTVDSGLELAHAAQEAEASISAGTWIGLAVGLLILAGALAALYAKWDDEGRPLPW